MARQTRFVGAISFLAIVVLAPFVNAGHSQERDPVIVLVDRGPKGFTFTLDSKPVAFRELMMRLGEKRGQWPRPAPPGIVIAHEEATFSMVDGVRGMFPAAGFDWPRVFYFGENKRLMLELTYADGIPFSPDGPPRK